MVIYFVLGALVLEAVTFHILGFRAFPEYFWYNFAIILVIAILVFVVPNYVAQYVIYTIILTVQLVFIYLNYSLSVIYGDLFSLEMIKLAGEAGAAITTNFIYFSVMLQLIAVYLAIVILGFILLKYCRKDKINVKYHYSIFNIIIILGVQCLVCGYSINTRNYINSLSDLSSDTYVLSDTFLMNTSILKSSSYEKFGTYGYFTNMIINQIQNEGKAIQKVTLNYFNNGSRYGEGDNKNEDVFGVDQGNNVIVIMMESMEWFGFGDGTYDKNLNNFSNELTPNIYGLINGEDLSKDTDNALIASNFFAKSKTNYSEGQGIIGSYHVGQSLEDVLISNETMGYAMPNVMKSLGYTTSYIHSNEISYYKRGTTHGKLGFDNVVGADYLRDENGNLLYKDSKVNWDDWVPEGDFMDAAIDYVVPTNYNEKPFYSFYLNLTSHGSYSASKNEKDGDALRYYDYVKYGDDDCDLDENGHYKVTTQNPDYTQWYSNILSRFGDNREFCEYMVYYQCGVMGLDEAVGTIIKRLNDYDIMDKTTILLYSDHYAYYEDVAHTMKGFDKNDFTSIELNTIPFILVSPGLKNYNQNPESENFYVYNNRFCSAYDVVPTLYELLGVTFNENFYLGHSLFRPADNIYKIGEQTKDMVVYYSNTGGLFSYDVSTFDFRTYITQTYASEETISVFKAECSNILKKVNFLNLLNRYNLYKDVKNK